MKNWSSSETGSWGSTGWSTWMPTTRRCESRARLQDLAILKAIGVNRWGKREVLGVSVALSEAEVHWREFLQALQR